MKRVSGAMLVVGFILTISYFVAKYTSMFWGVLVLAGMMLVIGKILTMNLSRETARKNGNLAESIEFYGDKMSFTMSNKKIINVKKADISKVIKYKYEMGYRFYLNDGTTIYYDFGQNLFTDRNITALVNELNFPNAKFETVE